MTKWKYGLSVAALAILAVSCSEATKNPVAPESTPEFNAVTPPNGGGACMVDDQQAWGKAGPTNCTANDISIAIATVGSVNGQAYTGQAVACNEGDTIFVDMTAQLLATSSSERHDVGIWIATDGGDARTGDCNHYNLIPGTLGTTNTDGDQCAGMTAPANKDTAVTLVPLGVIPVVCSDANNDGFVEVGACVAWGIPGGDQVCPDNADGVLPAGTANDFRAATTPDNAAKCNCDPFKLPITVQRVATIEVRKVCSPTTDAGTFDLNIDGVTQKNNATCAGGSASTTGAIEVSAGTNQNPGATHSTSENDFTTANYASSYVCTQNGHALSSGTGTSSGSFTALPDSAYVCTYTNVRNSGLTIVKDAVPNDAQDFAFTTTGAGLSNFSLDDDADGTLSNSQSFNNIASGVARTVTESAVTGWVITNIACTGATNSTIAYLGGAGGNAFGAGDNQVSVNLAPGENVSCTFTNTGQGSLTIVKDAIPDNAQDFAFTTSGAGLSNFSLDDDADGTLQNSQTFSGLTAGVARTVTEGAVSGWTTTNIACTGATNSTVAYLGGAGGNAYGAGDNQVSVTLAPGESVSCTFTNTGQGSLTIVKDAVPNDAQDFAYTTSGAGLSNFSLDDDADGTLQNSQVFTSLTAGVARTVTESAQTGWQITGIACTGATNSTVSINGASSNTSAYQTGDNSVSVTLAPGESVSCTFTNTKEGSITIVKDTQNPASDPTDFGFTATGTGTTSPFTLDDDADGTNSNSITFSNLLPGVRTFTEGANSNWDLTSLTCTGAATYSTNTTTRVASVTLAAGENVTCTYVNKRKAMLVVDKITTDGFTDSFDFTRNPGGVSFSLNDAATPNSSGFTLAPNTYRVCEVNLPAGWGDPSATTNGSAATIINPDSPQLLGNFCVDVTLAYGDSVLVAFTNTKLPSTGGTRTIGYWKNWSSCSKSNGSQYDKAVDKGFPTLDSFLGAGSSIYPIGDITTLSCLQAVALLSKSAIDGTKRAGDPVYNMVAQMLGAKLNLAAGAGTCTPLTTALTDAQTLLDAINFTGLGTYSGKTPSYVLTASQITSINTWAGVFGSYNEGTLGGTCPTHV